MYLPFRILWKCVPMTQKLPWHCLKNPVKWNDSDKIQIVFMLVLKHGEQKDFEHLYDIFIEIINTPKLQQNILKAKTYEEFLDVLYDGIK